MSIESIPETINNIPSPADAMRSFVGATVLTPPDENFVYYRKISLDEMAARSGWVDPLASEERFDDVARNASGDMAVDDVDRMTDEELAEQDEEDAIEAWNRRLVYEKLITAGVGQIAALGIVGQVAAGPLTHAEHTSMQSRKSAIAVAEVSEEEARRRQAEANANNFRTMLVTLATAQNRVDDVKRYARADSRTIRRAYSRHTSVPLKHL